MTKFLEGGLKLRVNHDKSGTFRPYESVFLGYTFHRYVQTRVIVAPKSVKRLKEKLKVIYRRSRGTSLSNAIEKLTQLLRGWRSITEDLMKFLQNDGIIWHQCPSKREQFSSEITTI